MGQGEVEKSNNLQVIKLADGDPPDARERHPVRLPCSLESVGEELDPSLEPLLLKQLFEVGGVMCIKLSDSIIEFSDQFRFYITTAMRNRTTCPRRR